MSETMMLLAAAIVAAGMLLSGRVALRLMPVVSMLGRLLADHDLLSVARDRRWLAIGLVGVLVASSLGAVLIAGRWWMAIVPLGVVLVVSAAAPGLLARRRRARLAEMLAATVDLIGASCESGLSFRSALGSARHDVAHPMSTEIDEVVREISLGGRVDDALRRFAERVDSSDARLFAAVVAVQLRAGGDLGSSLRRLAQRMSQREKLARELRGMTAQARSTATIVAVLPVAAAAVAELASPGAVTSMLARPVGLAIILASLAVQGVGLILVRLVSRVPA